MQIVAGLVVLLAFQLCGEGVVYLTGVPVPGAVIGMILLLCTLFILGGRIPNGVRAVSTGLLNYLALLFVPAGVGLVQYLGLLQQQGIVLLLALVASSLVTLMFVLLGLQLWAKVRPAMLREPHE